MRSAIAFLFVMTACVSGPSREEVETLKADPGYQIFVEASCAKCHGKYGQGIFGKQALKGLALKADEVKAVVREGKIEGMPKFEKTPAEGAQEGYFYISDEDLDVLASFLENRMGKDPVSASM